MSFCLSSIKGNTQTQKTIFQHISTKNGLSQNLVTAIFKDKRGYMWFGSWKGLNYYNGFNIITYKSDSTKKSINSNFINGICDDAKGDLWIATRNGLNKYLFDQNRFIYYVNDSSKPNSLSDNNIKCIIRDRKDNIWLGTINKGVDKLSFVNNKAIFKHYQYKEGENNCISANRINAIYEDHLGYIWIGTVNGLNRLDPQTEEIITFKNNPNDPNSLSNNSINTIFEGRDHQLWIGTKLGLNKMDRNSGLIKSYFEVTGSPTSLASSAIRHIAEDKDGNILIGTLDGLHRYLPAIDGFYRYEVNLLDDYSMNNNFISCILPDKEGNVWVGTEKGGINKFSTHQQAFYNFVHKPNHPSFLNQNIVNAIYEDEDFLWLGIAGGGLNQYDKKTSTFSYHTTNPSDSTSISHNFVSVVTKDSRGQLWAGTWGLGINKLTDSKKSSFKRFYYTSAQTDSINLNLISSMVEFPKGNMWITSRYGLSRMDLNTEKLHFFTPANTQGHKIYRASSLMVDRKHNLWVGTEEGLFRLKWNDLSQPDLNHPDSVFRYINRSKNKKSIAGNHVLSICEDRQGDIWISVYGCGLEKLDPKSIKGANAEFVHCYETNGLMNDIIFGILEDNNGNLWLSTENGLQKYDKTNNTSQNFYESDGIQGNQFYWCSYFKNKDGKLYFGGTQGLTTFDPAKIQKSKPVEHIIFTDLKVFNQSVPVQPDKKYCLKQHINNTHHIRLHHKQNVFTLEFTAVNYEINPVLQYAYRLDNFDQNWSYVDGSRPYATYTNLPPGNYLFRVKVANRDGIWSKKETCMSITIDPEWWQTILFKALMALSLSLLIVGYYLRRIHNLKKQQRKLELMVQQRTEQLHHQNQEILAQKNEIIDQKDEIATQNNQLLRYGNHLEEMVQKRTIDLELAKNKAIESDRLKSSFLTNLSHEIRTPLNAIIGFSTLIASKNKENERTKDWCKVILQNNDSLLHLIDDIIDFSKIETGQLQIKKQDVKIYFHLKELFDIYLSKIEQKITILPEDVSFKLVVAEDHKHLSIFTDAARVVQIISSLLDNAIKFTAKGSIELGFAPQEGKVLFWVKDTGIGIDPSNQELIFERFRKVEDDADHLYRGTGLGLAIAKHLVELLGGKIGVNSQLGSGATFFFTIETCSSSLNEYPEEESDTQGELSLKGCRILIAEDNDNNFEYFQNIFLKEEVTIARARNGVEVIELCKQSTGFDLILMDIRMPIMNGISACKEIKKTFPSIPIFSVTAYPISNEQDNILSAEFDEYITKPVSERQLIKLTKRYLSR